MPSTTLLKRCADVVAVAATCAGLVLIASAALAPAVAGGDHRIVRLVVSGVVLFICGVVLYEVRRASHKVCRRWMRRYGMRAPTVCIAAERNVHLIAGLLVLWMLAGAVIFVGGNPAGMRAVGPWGRAVWTVFFVLVGPALVLWSVYGRAARRARTIEKAVRRGIPVCFHCGYSLQGLRGTLCPECGERFDYPLRDGVPFVPGPAHRGRKGALCIGGRPSASLERRAGRLAGRIFRRWHV